MRRRFGFTAEGECYEITAGGGGERPKSHYVIGDTIEPTFCHVNNQTYESKSKLRADMKARGMIELGNDRVPKKTNWDDRAIHRDVERVFRDYGG